MSAKSFANILDDVARRTGSLLCVGLDPHPADLPAATADAARDFCLRLIAETEGLVMAYKPNAAFFEAYGPAGWAALAEVIAAVPAGIPVILDAKRGDIASTAEAYARSAFEQLGATAITLNPYLGRDSLEPFVRDPARGVFLLCKTSNPGAGDLQDLRLADGEMVYERVAALAQEWNENNNVALVVGATHPDALVRVRASAPDLWFLAPGVGAQGGDLRAALRAGLRADGLGMLIPVSRAVARAESPRRAAEALRDEIRAIIREETQNQVEQVSTGAAVPAWLADGLLAAGCVKFGQFTLKSGLQSPIYLDLRQLVSHPALLADVGRAYLPILRQLTFDRLAALPYAALPIGTAVSLAGGWPLVYPRREVKGYGTGAAIEGAYLTGERVVVIDDLATTGGSKFEAIDKLTAAGLMVEDVVVLIDRESGAADALFQAGYRLHAVTHLSELLDYWEANGAVPAEQIAAVRAFMAQEGRSATTE
jgi:uridine monophosphate synthetase